MKPVSRETAMNMILNKWEIKAESHLVLVKDAIDRIISENIYSINTLPVVRSSKADGIAVDSKRLENGVPDTSNWILGIDYVRADTGDDFSDEFDTVIPIENVKFNKNGDISILDSDIKKGNNINKSGSMIKEGELLVRKGTKIKPIHLAVLVSGGVEKVKVIKKPKVVFIPTGSELIEAFNSPQRGQNIESNSFMVKALSEEYGGECTSYPIVKDKILELESALNNALEEADIVLINGGSSKGEEDYNTKLLRDRGALLQHYVTAAPGRPIGIAIENNIPIINVPGPIIGAFYAMDWCVNRLINEYLGIPIKSREKLQVKLAEDVKSPKIFEFFMRLKVIKENGEYTGIPLLWDVGFPQMMVEANALFISPLDVDKHEKGDILEVELLYGKELIEERF